MGSGDRDMMAIEQNRRQFFRIAIVVILAAAQDQCVCFNAGGLFRIHIGKGVEQ